MTETEKQEGQKTVVAFITGLLVGGLLVWIFSSSPKPEPVVQPTVDTTQTQSTTTTSDNTSTNDTNQTNTQAVPVSAGDSSIKVSDQKAGATVMLGDVKYPEKTGWVVVRDFLDGNPGNVLGASRYSTSDSLTPKEMNLLRNTVASSTYQVVFYSDNGDKVFDLKDDKLVQGVSATFKAQ